MAKDLSFWGWHNEPNVFKKLYYWAKHKTTGAHYFRKGQQAPDVEIFDNEVVFTYQCIFCPRRLESTGKENRENRCRVVVL